MSRQEESSPWAGRIIAVVVCVALVVGGVYAYGRFFSQRKEVQKLKNTIQTSTDPLARATAIRELVRTKDTSGAELFRKALEDEDDRVRCAAATALGQMGNKAAADVLMGALKDKSLWVRQSAATALGALKDASAVAPLVALLKDKDSSVRKAAVYALGEIGDNSVVKDLEPLVKGDPEYDVQVAAESTVTFLKTGQHPAPNR